MKNLFNKNIVYFAKMKENAKIPNKKDEDAGYDIFACFDEDFIYLKQGETKLIPTGIAWACNKKYYMQIEERSSTGTKGIKRSAGILDSGYRGEIKIAIFNSTCKDLYISNLKEKELFSKYPKIKKESIIYNTEKAIAQGIIHKVEKIKVKEIPLEKLLTIPSERGNKGWGSSNKK